MKRHSVTIRLDGSFKTCITCKQSVAVSEFAEYRYTTALGNPSKRLASVCKPCCSKARSRRWFQSKNERTPAQLAIENEQKKKWANKQRHTAKTVPSHQLCRHCGLFLSAAYFYKSYVRSSGLYPYCKKCNRELSRVNSKKVSLKKKYGITLDQYNHLIALQNGKCAICKEPNPVCVDHDHSSGMIRGILCHLCNLAVGNLKDNVKSAKNLVKYLIKFYGEQS